MANFMQMMQKAQLVKKKMEDIQARAAEMTVSGEAGDLVTCTINGKFEVQSIKIAKDAVNPSETDVLEDLIVAALRDARQKAEKMIGTETEKMMKDLGLPPGMSLPF